MLTLAGLAKLELERVKFMEAFVAMLFFTRKPLGLIWMLFKMFRPHLRESRA